MPRACPSGIEEATVLEHGDEDTQEPVGDTAQCARVRVAALTQAGVIGFAGRVTHRRDPRPVIERVTQPAVAGVTHEDHPALATLLGNGRNACVCAQSVVISLSEGRRSFGEHRGGYDSSHSWQRPEDLDVAVLALLAVIVLGGPKLIEQGFEARAAALALSVDQAQARQEQGDMFGSSLDYSAAGPTVFGVRTARC